MTALPPASQKVARVVSSSEKTVVPQSRVVTSDPFEVRNSPQLIANAPIGIRSFDGTALLSSDSGELAGSTLWQLIPRRRAVRQYPPRPEEFAWQASEIPVAVSAHAERVIPGARDNAPCSYTPRFTSRVHDVATDAIVDELPPSPSSNSADLSAIAYGPVLCCLR